MANHDSRLISRLPRVGISVVLGLACMFGLLLTMGASSKTAQASPAIVQEVFTSTVMISPTARSHKFLGAGVHIFDADYLSTAFTSTLGSLGLKYIRVQYGPYWNDKKIPLPPDCNDETYEQDYPGMYEFVRNSFNGDYSTRLTNAMNISVLAHDLGIETIFLNWRAHTSWHITNTNELRKEKVDDYACFVAENVKYLTDQGVEISYLEPTNEPSIGVTNTNAMSDTKIPPDLYNTFVTRLATYLERRNLSEIKILGPGLPYLNHDNTVITWTQALNDNGVAAISAWASHAWDPVFFPNTPEPEILRMKLDEFHEAIKAKEDPNHPKPIFITEFACVNDPGNGICAVENMLMLLDSGANAVIYWHLRAQDWDAPNRAWALLNESYAVSPTFKALSSVLPFISGNEVSVLKTQVDGRITAASFVQTDTVMAEKQVAVVLVNRSSVTEAVLIDIKGTMVISDRITYDGNSQTISKGQGFNRCQINSCGEGTTDCNGFSLPPNSISTLVFIRHPFQIYLPMVTNSVAASMQS